MDEKIKSYGAGLLGFGGAGYHFLFNRPGIPLALIWEYPLKVFGVIIIGIAGSMAAGIGTDIYKNHIKAKIFKNDQNEQPKQPSKKDDQRTA